MEDGHGRAEESLIDIMNCIRDQIVVEWKLFYYAFKKYNQQSTNHELIPNQVPTLSYR